MTGPIPVNVLDYGAVGNGFADNTTAIQAALDFAAANGNRPVEIPPGVYRYWGIINVTGCELYGHGDQTVLYTGNDGYRAIHLLGSGSSLRDMRLVTHHTGRNGSNVSAAVLVDNATNFNVQNVTIYRSASVGVFVNSSSAGTIENCTIMETRADGIHITNSIGTAPSFDIWVTNCRVERTGDDGIASVGYGLSASARNYDIHFQNNTSKNQGHGRGITMAGTRDSEIVGNYIEGGSNDNAGILVMADRDPTFGTGSCFNITVSGNTIREAGGNIGGNGAIMVHQMYGTVNSTYDHHHITVNNNQIYAARSDAIRIMGLNTRDITITNNTIYDPGDLAINLFDNPTNVTQTNNQEFPLSSYPGDQVSQVQGSDGVRPVANLKTVVVTCNGTANSGWPWVQIKANGLAVQTYFEVKATRSLNQTFVKAIKMRVAEDTRYLTFVLLGDGGDPGRNAFLKSVTVDGVEMLASEVSLPTDTDYDIYIMPPARNAAQLKAEFPIGVQGGTTAQDMHYLIDTLERRTHQDCWRKGGGRYDAKATQSGTTFLVENISDFTVPADAPAGWNCRVYLLFDVQPTFSAVGGNIRNVSGHTKPQTRFSMVKLFVYQNAGSAPQVILSGSTGV